MEDGDGIDAMMYQHGDGDGDGASIRGYHHVDASWHLSSLPPSSILHPKLCAIYV